MANPLIRKGICRNQVGPPRDAKLQSAKWTAAVNSNFAGHGEAAVKLQRDWIADPQTLPFAQHIKTHALVALVQKGLQYYEIEQSMIQVRRMVLIHLRSSSQTKGIRTVHDHHYHPPRFLDLHPLERLCHPRKTLARKKPLLRRNFPHEPANTAETVQQTDCCWIFPFQHRLQSGAAVAMAPKVPMAMAEAAIAWTTN